MYRAEPITASEIARRLSISSTQALAALHREGVELDPGRHASREPGYCCPAAAARCKSLSAGKAEWAVRRYRDEGWSYRMIGEHLGVSGAKVRAELQRRGIPVHPRQLVGPGSRTARTEAPVDQMRKLYVESEWSAADVAAQLDSTINVVLRTGHAHLAHPAEDHLLASVRRLTAATIPVVPSGRTLSPRKQRFADSATGQIGPL
jgi:hypothetical protein